MSPGYSQINQTKEKNTKKAAAEIKDNRNEEWGQLAISLDSSVRDDGIGDESNA